MKSTSVGRLDLVDGDDVRVIEGGGGLRFLDEPAAAVSIRQAIGGQHLDGHLATQPRVAGAIDLAHAAGAERRDDFVRAEPGAGEKPHRRRLNDPRFAGATHPIE